jgi:hypothetical protein
MIEPKRICQGLPWVMDGDRSEAASLRTEVAAEHALVTDILLRRL